MKNLKRLVLAACLATGLGNVGAQAMPIHNLATIDQGATPQQVRWVCSPYSGRCWWRPRVRAYPYHGFYGGPALYAGPRFYGYGGGYRGYRGGWRGRW